MFCSFNCRCSLLNILELEFHSAASQLGSKDFFSLPWEEFVLEHNRHHASTVDLLIQGEFGWDPEEFHYALQQWAGPFSTNWPAGHIFFNFPIAWIFLPCQVRLPDFHRTSLILSPSRHLLAMPCHASFLASLLDSSPSPHCGCQTRPHPMSDRMPNQMPEKVPGKI